MAGKSVDNVTISLDDSVNVDDEMLTVTFNQFQTEDSSQETESIEYKTKTDVEIDEKSGTSSPRVDTVTPNETALQSASQYFMEESTPTRSRTTSDNEFFDHLVAGNSAMMADENVSDVISADAVETSSDQPDTIIHCDSTAKLSVTSENEHSLPDKLEDLSAPHESTSIDSAFKTTSDSEDGIVMKMANNSETFDKTVNKTDENIAQLSEVRLEQSEVKLEQSEDDIPVFRYFADDSNISSEAQTSAFDSFSSSTPIVDNVPEADAFSAAIEESEFNRRSDAWIPSQSTFKFTSAQTESSYAHQHTKPRLILTEILNDPVLPMMVSTVESSFIVARKAKMLTQDSVPCNINGLRQLMEMGCYRAAINLTTKLISSTSQTSKLTPELLQLWFCRIGLLVKVKMFKEAHDESLPFSPSLDNPDIYYDFYPDDYTGRKGSMASFGFRLLLAEIPRYIGQYEQSLERLHVLLNKVMMIIKNLDNGLSEDGNKIEMKESNRKASKELWCQRERNVIYSLVNACTSHKDYVLAISLMNSLIKKESGDITPFLWSAKGRIFLQLGNVVGAQDSFLNASLVIPDEMKSNTDLKIMGLINKALIAIAQNNFQDAYNSYKEASTLDPSDPMLKNNMAACLLYTGKMKESLSTLEGAIKNDPENFLHEGILFNVCTLYELESSHSNQKKANMLALISQYKGDAFNTACLKIS